MTKSLWATLWIAGALGMQPLAAGAAPPWLSVTPVAGKYSAAFSLNDAGQYAVNNFGPDSPFELASIGGPDPQDIGTLGGTTSRISAINNKAEAVGASTTAEGAMHAFFYSSGRMHDLTTAYGVERAAAVNDRGDITGQAPGERAMVVRNGRAEVFGTPISVAGDINAAGDILVEYFSPGDRARTAVYRDGRLNDLPTRGGEHLLGGSLNDAGWVSGYGSTPEGGLHAWLYDGKAITDLTPLAANGIAYDINNLGQVVGTMDDRAFLYAGGRLVDLNTLVDPEADLLLTVAEDINNHGQILARYCDRAGVFCYGTVLLDGIAPVPEPPQVLMLAAALALLARRRARSARAIISDRGQGRAIGAAVCCPCSCPFPGRKER